MTFSLILSAILAILLIWAILNWREGRRAAAGQSRHSGLRLIFAAIAGLTILFSGGCGAAFLIGWIMDGMRSGGYVGWEIISILSLPPLLVGLLVWWLSMRRGSGAQTPPSSS